MTRAVLTIPPACPSGKIPYATRDEATIVVRASTARGRRQWTYRCRHCAAFHTTRRPS